MITYLITIKIMKFHQTKNKISQYYKYTFDMR